jgi:hypothetical protein
MALSHNQRHALRLLADAPNGGTATIMLAHRLHDFAARRLGAARAGDDGKACHARGAAADQGYMADDHRGRAAGAWMMAGDGASAFTSRRHAVVHALDGNGPQPAITSTLTMASLPDLD